MGSLKVKVNNEAESREAQELYYGVGFRTGKYSAYNGNTQKEQYRIWSNALKRCYSKWFKENRKSYDNCVMSDNFKNYDYFYEWCENQVGFGGDFALDKDLLVKNNKTYSEDTCVFLPREINNALILRESKRGDLPIGVSFSERDHKYRVTLTMFGKNINGGYFKEACEAFKRYKELKELYLKSLASMYKDRIDIRAYEALITYEVCVND